VIIQVVEERENLNRCVGLLLVVSLSIKYSIHPLYWNFPGTLIMAMLDLTSSLSLCIMIIGLPVASSIFNFELCRTNIYIRKLMILRDHLKEIGAKELLKHSRATWERCGNCSPTVTVRDSESPKGHL
jgi:hypothetical protein